MICIICHNSKKWRNRLLFRIPMYLLIPFYFIGYFRRLFFFIDTFDMEFIIYESWTNDKYLFGIVVSLEYIDPNRDTNCFDSMIIIIVRRLIPVHDMYAAHLRLVSIPSKIQTTLLVLFMWMTDKFFFEFHTHVAIENCYLIYKII